MNKKSGNIKKTKRKIIPSILKLLYKLCPSILPILFVQKILLTAVPYIVFFYSGIILDALLEKRSFEEIFRYVLWMVTLLLILNLAGWWLDKLANVRKYLLQNRMEKMLTEKALMMDYEQLEIQETMQLIEKAYEGMRSNGDLGSFCTVFANLIGHILDLVYAAALFLPVLLPGNATGNTFIHQFMASSVSALLLNVILLVQIVVWIWSSKNIARIQNELFEINIDGNRRFFYFLSFISEYKRGKDMRMYPIREIVEKNYHSDIHGILQNFMTAEKRMERYSLINECVNGLYAFVCYIYVGIKACLGMISVGNVSRSVSAFTKFSQALGMLIQDYTSIRLQAGYFSHFLDYLEIENHKYDGTLPIEKRDDCAYEFEFRDVSFSYPNSQEPVLDHVSLKLKIGKKMAIVGPNGAGKSTFIKLLCRLYDPTEGEILLNGINIKYYDYKEYIQCFSVVFQDFRLFPFSLGENISISRNYDEEKVEKCLELAGFGERAKTLEKGLKTNLYKLQEDGLEISGGEAQKIAIGRALYKDAPMVIMDEPTSALDPISEYELYRSFDRLVQEKTAIYISHRMSSCRFCQQILVFDKGKIIQQGSHDELVADREGLYFEMWSSQARYYQ